MSANFAARTKGDYQRQTVNFTMFVTSVTTICPTHSLKTISKMILREKEADAKNFRMIFFFLSRNLEI